MLLKLPIFLLSLVPAIAAASDIRPAELPPADFISRQYIDSRGCVFLRDEAGGWMPRVSRDGSPICGYPPTLSARGIDGRPRLRALDPNAGRSRAELLEQALSETVLSNLRTGELAGDPNPLQQLPDMGPEPADPAPSRALKAALAAAPAMRRNMGEALQPNRRLCELLGYDDGVGGQVPGRDPSQGYCSSLPESDLSRLTFVRSIAEIRKETAPAEQNPPVSAASGGKAELLEPEKKTETATAPAPVAVADKRGGKATKNQETTVQISPSAKKARPAGSLMSGKTGSGKAVPGDAVVDKAAAGKVASASANKAAPAKQVPTPAGTGVIPAGARYIQFGTYADVVNADRAAQVVARMGYPVMRGRDKLGKKDVQFILAGPFEDRESIVRALDAIRRAGFRDAYPR